MEKQLNYIDLLNTRNEMNGLDLLKIIPEKTIKIAFFDPQYRGVLDKLSYGNESAKQKGRAELNQMPEEVIKEFISAINKSLKDSGYLFLWIDKFHLVEGIHGWLEGTNLKPVDMITWHKQTFGLGYRSRRVSEYLVVLQKTPIIAKKSWTKHNIPNVWIEKIEKGSTHPHTKPKGLQEALIEATTSDFDIVLDPAAGSFSVMKAAAKINRNFIGSDLKVQ